MRDHDDAKVTFACRFHCSGNQFWDNNNGRNYVFQNVPMSSSSVAPSSVSRPSMFASSRYSSFDDFDYTCNRIEAPPAPPQQQQQPPQNNFNYGNNYASNYVKSQETKPEPQTQSPTINQSCSASSASPPANYTTGGGGGSHLSGSMYSPTTNVSFYEHAYGCYSNYGSACFY